MTYKELIETLNSEFPFLKNYSERTMYMVLKPFMLGFRVSKERYFKDEYRISFEVIPLWLKDSSMLQKHTIVQEELRTKNNHQIFISINREDNNLCLALESARFLYGKILNGKVSLTNFMEFIYNLEKILQKQKIRDWYTTTTILKLLLGISVFYKIETLYAHA